MVPHPRKLCIWKEKMGWGEVSGIYTIEGLGKVLAAFLVHIFAAPSAPR